MKLLQYIGVILIAFIGTVVKSQNCSNIKTLELKTMYVVKPLPIIDERDVMWHRRLWREIDVTEKINQYLYFGNEKDKINCSFYDTFNDFIFQKKGFERLY